MPIEQSVDTVIAGDHVAAMRLLDAAGEGTDNGPAARGGTLRRWIDSLAGAFRQPSAWAHTVWSDTQWASTLVLPSEARAGAPTEADTPGPH